MEKEIPIGVFNVGGGFFRRALRHIKDPEKENGRPLCEEGSLKKSSKALPTKQERERSHKLTEKRGKLRRGEGGRKKKNKMTRLREEEVFGKLEKILKLQQKELFDIEEKHCGEGTIKRGALTRSVRPWADNKEKKGLLEMLVRVHRRGEKSSLYERGKPKAKEGRSVNTYGGRSLKIQLEGKYAGGGEG